MNLDKIGKFICERRKNKKWTQEQLAEKLEISDRAVSKWERGICLPDVSIMISLCELLEINVNELLSGEMLNNNEYEKNAEKNMLDMVKKEEINNKSLLFYMYAFMISSILFYMMLLIITGFFVPEGVNQIIIIILSTTIFAVSIFVVLKFEIDIGYYECKKCHFKFIPNFKEVFWAMHMGTTRYLKCPKCNKKYWSKKVLIK